MPLNCFVRCWLMGAMTNLKASTMIDGNKIFEEFKGAIAEQYVL